MSYPTDRLILFDRGMNPLPEIAPSEVLSRVRTEEINGEHSLVLVTSRLLEEGWRMLTVDGTGRWREWVVTEIDEEHALGKSATGTYHMVWSLQYDLTSSYSHTHAEIGYGSSPVTSPLVAAVILEDVVGWEVGPCDAANVPAGKGAVMIYESAWSRLSKAVEVMGCEVDSVIEVSNLYGVTARKLCLKAHVGSETVTRRFDWTHDLTSIKRTPDPGPYYCRVVPLGKGETEYADDDETTFEWPLDITEETGTAQNPGPYYIEDAEAAAVFRRSDGNGGWIYPTIAVSYSSEDDPELLLNAAMEDLHNHTRPGVTYEASVVQFGEAGMDAYGVSIGDDVHVVDYGFNESEGLRLQGRVIKMEVDELSPDANTTLTIGQLRDGMLDLFKELDARMDDLISQNSSIYQSLASMTTARYIDELLARINAEINATGGYSYLVPGEGLITYDTAVADPLVGSEASQVVQVKGGSIRIANTKNSGFAGIDDWDWRTVFTSGHILSDLVTAVKVTSGYIGNATNSNYWNLDTGELLLQSLSTLYANNSGNQIRNLTKIGVITTSDQVLRNRISAWSSSASQTAYNFQGLFVQNFVGDRVGDSIHIIPSEVYSWDSTSIGQHSTIAVDGALVVLAGLNETKCRYIELSKTMAKLAYERASSGETSVTCNASGVNIGDGTSHLYVSSDNSDDAITLDVGSTGHTGTITLKGANVDSGRTSSSTTTINGYLSVPNRKSTLSSVEATSLSVSGSKSRLVETDNYDGRLLYCYETPSPMFGDIGSGTIGSDGLCYVQLDDEFAETARTDFAYQVFLQKCGAGDLWVEEKNPSYFVVNGTPNLKFDWEVKARQKDLESLRLESFEITSGEEDELFDMSGSVSDMDNEYVDSLPTADESAEAIEELYEPYEDELERMYDEELMTA